MGRVQVGPKPGSSKTRTYGPLTPEQFEKETPTEVEGFGFRV